MISEIDGFEIRTADIFALLVGSSEKGIHTDRGICTSHVLTDTDCGTEPTSNSTQTGDLLSQVVDGGELHRACCRRCLRARLLVQDKVTLNYGGIDGTLPATGALDIRRIGDAGIAVAHGGAPGRSPCRVCRSLRVQAVRPKGTSDSTSTKRVAGSTGDWPLGGAMAVGWRNLWMAGPLQMRCLFSCFWVTAMLTPTPFPINALHHRGERSPRRSLFLAGPLVLPSLHTTAQKLCNIHLHCHPPSGIDRRGTPPVGGAILLHIPQLPSLFPHTPHPVRPTVLPFHPLSSAHCPLRCPLKTALAKNRRRGVGAAPRQGNPFRSPRLPTERSSLVVFFPFAFRTHTVLSRYRLIVKKALRYAPPFQSTGTSVGSHSPSTSSAPAKQTPIHHRRVESVAPRLALRSHIPSSTRQTFVPPPCDDPWSTPFRSF